MSLWVLEYRLKSGTRVRTLPLPEDIADRQLADCHKRGESAVLMPALRDSRVTWSRR